jgi:hypothetical protein
VEDACIDTAEGVVDLVALEAFVEEHWDCRMEDWACRRRSSVVVEVVTGGEEARDLTQCVEVVGVSWAGRCQVVENRVDDDTELCRLAWEEMPMEWRS